MVWWSEGGGDLFYYLGEIYEFVRDNREDEGTFVSPLCCALRSLINCILLYSSYLLTASQSSFPIVILSQSIFISLFLTNKTT